MTNIRILSAWWLPELLKSNQFSEYTVNRIFTDSNEYDRVNTSSSAKRNTCGRQTDYYLKKNKKTQKFICFLTNMLEKHI